MTIKRAPWEEFPIGTRVLFPAGNIFSRLSTNRAKGRQAAFSLVEMAIAVAIIGSALIVITGLTATALGSFHQSKGAAVSALIAQQIFAQVQVGTFSLLTGNATAPGNYQLLNPNGSGTPYRYFDEQGNETANTQGVAVYMVNVRVVTQTPISSSGTPVYFSNLATVTVQVVYDPGLITPDLNGSTDLWTVTQNGFVSANGGALQLPAYTYNCLVARGS